MDKYITFQNKEGFIKEIHIYKTGKLRPQTNLVDWCLLEYAVNMNFKINFDNNGLYIDK